MLSFRKKLISQLQENLPTDRRKDNGSQRSNNVKFDVNRKKKASSNNGVSFTLT